MDSVRGDDPFARRLVSSRKARSGKKRRLRGASARRRSQHRLERRNALREECRRRGEPVRAGGQWLQQASAIFRCRPVWNHCRHDPGCVCARRGERRDPRDRKSTRLNSSHVAISYAVFCLKKKKRNQASNVYIIITNKENVLVLV